MPTRHWSLRTSLILMLVLVSTVTFVIAAAALTGIYYPHIQAQTERSLNAKSADLAETVQTSISLLARQLEMLANTADHLPPIIVQRRMEAIIGPSGFSAVYRIDKTGTVTLAATDTGQMQAPAPNLVGDDLSYNRLRQQVVASQYTVTSDKYRSPVSQRYTVAIGAWTGQDVFIGEITLSWILESINGSAGSDIASVWVVDSRGDILADTESPERVGVANIANLPLITQAQRDGKSFGQIRFEGLRYNMAVAQSPLPNWLFAVRDRAGWHAPQLRTALELGLTCLLAMGTLSVALAPLWANRLARPIQAITAHANRLVNGEKVADWPDSPVVELNQLSHSLADIFDATQQRERELQAIFDASPAGMIVADMYGDGRFTRANDAILEIFGYPREEILTYTGKTLRVWKNPENRKQFIAQLRASAHAHMEAWMRRKDGTEFLANLSARLVKMGNQWLVIWVVENITEYHRIEQEVRELNTLLEARVLLRTGQLSAANAELSTTIEHLKIAQGELVRTEKLASLGSLVAGVAHELNTPIGNGVMAVSTMRSSLKRFRAESTNGLKRSVLDSFVEAVDTGSTIAERNLERAAELVVSFKQVAADQTSSQRRSFKLDEVVREITLTLGPTLRHSVARLNVDIPSAITMDSYPGPLGQILTNLITNATVHAFANREHGTIEVRAEIEADRLKLRISDDGIGIAPDMLSRIFDPFVTTRMGRGGTGLGLHIAHNIASNILGGSISVSSTAGQGTTFELNIPLTAPAPDSTSP